MIRYCLETEKTVQAAIYLIKKSKGQLNYMFLIKLLYLSDRKSMDLYDEPITGDVTYSLDQGPVISTVLDWIKNKNHPTGKIWNDAIKTSFDSYEVELIKDLGDDELSESDEEILDEIYSQEIEKFNPDEPFKYIDELHKRLPEWTDPEGHSIPLSKERIFEVLGRTPIQVYSIDSFQDEHKDLKRLLRQCR